MFIRKILAAAVAVLASASAFAAGEIKGTAAYNTALQQTQYDLGLPITSKIADGIQLNTYVGLGETRDQFIHNQGGFDTFAKFGEEVATNLHGYDVAVGASTQVFAKSQSENQVYASISKKLWN